MGNDFSIPIKQGVRGNLGNDFSIPVKQGVRGNLGNDFSIEFWNCSDNVIFFHVIISTIFQIYRGGRASC